MDNWLDYKMRYFSEKKPQTEMTLEYMRLYGSITPLEALNGFGCFRLPARISDLRKAGHDIKTTIADGKKKYAIYTLNE